jgi:ferric-dicitrate binding protein FerR (iron transport regulator)
VSSAPNAPVVPSDRLEYTEKVILKPGQQAQLVIGRKGQPEIAVIDADIEKVMAWKNGLFNFQGKSLEEVMHQLERWYDIEVVYEKGIPNIRFGGEMSRDISLAGLIRVLEKSEVHFRIEEGRRLVVLP